MPDRRLLFSKHARDALANRDISVTAIRRVIETGEVIKEYPDDEPFPSRLLLGWDERRPLHVVAADNPEGDETVVVTVYEPNRFEWENDFRTRRTR